MSDNIINRALEKSGWILADGGIGTQLFDMGLQAGDAPELWNKTESKKIRSLYKGSIDAGSDLFLTNSFGSNACRLRLHGKDKDSFELSKLSAEIASEEINKQSRSIILAGSIGPTGEILEPLGSLSFREAVEIFHIQAEGLKEGGVDVLWIETISHFDELRAAVKAAELSGIGWCGTMSFDTSGRTMMGHSSKDFSESISKMPYKPLAYGANCGVGPSDLIRTILGFSQSEIPIIAKGNAGIPQYREGKIHYDGTAEIMSVYACLARDAGAKIIGGCCGTTPIHLATMRQALENHKILEKPSIEKVVEKLGSLSSDFDGTEDSNDQPKRKSKRKHKAN